MRWLVATVMVLAAIAGEARADLVPFTGGRPAAREVTVTGTVTGLQGSQITLTAPGGQPQTFSVAQAHADLLGLRLGDTAAVTLVGPGNPFAAPVATIDRILPAVDLRLRVYAAGATTAPPAPAQGQGCWVARGADEGIELCFTSVSRGIALRYAPDGALACSAALTLQRERARFAAAPATCAAGASWPIQAVACDGGDSCRIVVDAGREEVLSLTRR